jgi:hypothetical protein
MAADHRVVEHSIAREFTDTPGPRFEVQGPWSGEMFRKKHLSNWFRDAIRAGATLVVDLDGGYGYAPSFLEESFGGLARECGIERVLSTVEIRSSEQPLLEEKVRRYIRESSAT